ncbi:MAG: hypothetical protein LUK37_14865, partial [Clostridia bacterium]|nr:hypothetical protein [Clostridia bacterium]
MPDGGRVSGPYPPGVRQFHGHLGQLVRAVLFIQVLQPAHDRGFIALHMALLDSGNAFVEHPLAASHAFGRLCHFLAFSLQGVGSPLQPPFFFLVLLVFKFLEAPFTFLLRGPV